MNNIPIILTGPSGCGKSYWIQNYAKTLNKQLFVCPCRKDRTLRDGRQKLHVWARRTEPAILWLEGADDLTPEAQAFLRRILETHATDVLFILECRDACRLQEPIRSRCTIKRINLPTWNELDVFLNKNYKNINTNEIKDFLYKSEYSYRRIKQIVLLQTEYKDIWDDVKIQRNNEREILNKLEEHNLIEYIKEGYNPYMLINSVLSNEKVLNDYGKCIELSGSLWAFLGSALYTVSTTPQKEEE